MIYAIAT
jgi:hypothetical protein